MDNRYPQIFEFVQRELGAASNIRILSYGCSLGDEVFSLRRYFPYATIKGIDINPANIAACRRRLKKSPDAAIAFAVARSTTAEPSAGYDAIFAMAVLRHGSLGQPGVIRCDHLLAFENFARAVADFERCLKPGGLLIIRHSNFRLRDAPAGRAFETILQLPTDPGTPLFGPDNRHLPDCEYPDTGSTPSVETLRGSPRPLALICAAVNACSGARERLRCVRANFGFAALARSRQEGYVFGYATKPIITASLLTPLEETR